MNEFINGMIVASTSTYKWKKFKRKTIDEMEDTIGGNLNFTQALRQKLRRLDK